MSAILIPYDTVGRGYACSVCGNRFFARINADSCCDEKAPRNLLQEVTEVDFSE